MSSLSVETLSSLAFNSSLADASDSEVTAVSLIGLAGVVLIFLSMLLVSAAGDGKTNIFCRIVIRHRDRDDGGGVLHDRRGITTADNRRGFAIVGDYETGEVDSWSVGFRLDMDED